MYAGDGAINTCIDLNECDLNTDNCVSNAVCTNTIGSYDCTCNIGYDGDGVADGTACSDINECVAKTHNCDVNASCTNTIGSFTCSCNNGFAFNAISGVCDDIDECLTNADDCHIMATCQNTVGSFDCTCGTDWNGDGHGQFGCAQDVCSLCDASASCVNDQCICPVGFDGNGIDCTRSALVIPIQKSPSTAGRRQNTCKDSYWLEIAENPNNVVVLKGVVTGFLKVL